MAAAAADSLKSSEEEVSELLSGTVAKWCYSQNSLCLIFSTSDQSVMMALVLGSGLVGNTGFPSSSLQNVTFK